MKHDFKLDPNIYLPLHEVVFNTLRRAILTGELAPGERLMEIHLANQFGVSRTPVREAIHMLELEGLAVLRPSRGAVVASITAESVKDVLEVRRALDVLCAQLACRRITEDGVDMLKSACESFEEAASESARVMKTLSASKTSDIQNEIAKVASCDIAFHDIIIDASGNRRLKQLIDELSEQMYRYRFEYLKDTGIYDQLIKEHRAIYEAIARADEKAAAKACELHIDNQELAIMKQVAP